MSLKGFFLAWLTSALIMLGASYLWHGVILNDIERLNYPKEIYLTGSIITYLILGFVLTKIYLMKFTRPISKRPMLRGIISGASLGIVAYILSLVIGVSFSSSLTIKNILFDMTWQTTEQIIGGIVVGMAYVAEFEGNFLRVVARKLFGED